jgi:hypothetical protein
MVKRVDGYAILPLLFLLIFIGISFSFVHSRINDRMSFDRRQRISVAAKHVATTISMIYSNRQSCLANLDNGHLAGSLSQLKARSDTGKLRLRIPGNNAVAIARNSQFLGLKISDIRLGNPIQPFPTEQGFIIPLNVSVEVGANLPAQTVSIPFYFVSDAVGKIRDCYATAYTNPQMSLTLEDAICKQSDPTQIYTASGQFCSPGSSLPGPANQGPLTYDPDSGLELSSLEQ